MRPQDVPKSTPHYDKIIANLGEMPADGGSCLAAPDGSWLIEPIAGKEALVYAEIDPREVLRERQNFDPSGHYSRPDVTRLDVNRERQRVIRFTGEINTSHPEL